MLMRQAQRRDYVPRGGDDFDPFGRIEQHRQPIAYDLVVVDDHDANRGGRRRRFCVHHLKVPAKTKISSHGTGRRSSQRRHPVQRELTYLALTAQVPRACVVPALVDSNAKVVPVPPAASTLFVCESYMNRNCASLRSRTNTHRFPGSADGFSTLPEQPAGGAEFSAMKCTAGAAASGIGMLMAVAKVCPAAVAVEIAAH